jgi:hypothetical protein
MMSTASQHIAEAEDALQSFPRASRGTGIELLLYAIAHSILGTLKFQEEMITKGMATYDASAPQEFCPTCGQPDNCGDCDHTPLDPPSS